jgi:Raf kinase inhibitor-like YbhB/YbcL family protein
MRLTSTSFAHLAAIPTHCAFGQPDGQGGMQFAENLNPQLAFHEVPEGTKSFALICIDTDVPTQFEDVNQAGRELPADMPRQGFIHWVIVDLPADLREIAEGSCSVGVVAGGKQEPMGPDGSRQGVNDYGGFMGDGVYRGYDGPCPPWNDARMHHYTFVLYALDVATLPVAGDFTAADVQAAMVGHILAEARLTGTYAIHPALHGR